MIFINFCFNIERKGAVKTALNKYIVNPMVKIKKEIWWMVDSGEESGLYNMSFDEFLAKNVKKRPILRFFQWKPYCLSLGYNQKNEIFEYGRLKENDIDIVKRPTGGRAVLHADEVTYSVIISDSHPLFYLGITELYKAISYALQKGLKYLGINAFIEKNKIGFGKLEKLSPYCFSSIARYEIKYNGKKIIGSAQRRYKNSVLQHGSIPLTDYYINLTEFISDNFKKEKIKSILKSKSCSISTLLNKDVSYKEVVNNIKKGFEDTFNIVFQRKDISASQKTSIEKLSKRFKIDI